MQDFGTLGRIIPQGQGAGKGGAVGNAGVGFLVFDVESVADGELVARLRYPDQTLEPRAAISRYRQELLERQGSDFIPYTYQIPICLVIAKVAHDYQLLDLVALDEPQCRPHVITQLFWSGWEAYQHPTWVTFNGRSFDLPLLELAAFRYGVSVPRWFGGQGKGYQQCRNRYNIQSHWDLYDVLTNFGATRFHGGLNLAAQLLGKPGKLQVQGCMVQDLYHAERLTEIGDYCRCDVLDTYFVFLRAAVLTGQLTLAREQALIASTRAWLDARRDQCAAYATYLDHWGGWVNPWEAKGEA